MKEMIVELRRPMQIDSPLGPSAERGEIPTEICLASCGSLDRPESRAAEVTPGKKRGNAGAAARQTKTTCAVVNSPRNSWWFEGVELAIKCIIPLTEDYRPRLFSLHLSTAISDTKVKAALRSGIGYVLINLGFNDVEIELCDAPHAFPDLADRSGRAALLCRAEAV